MPATERRTRRYVLAARPTTLTGPVEDGVLRFEEDARVPDLQPGQVLAKVEWISVDASTRGYMNETRSYRAPSPLGETMSSRGAGLVEVSHHPDFASGDRVYGMLGWQEEAVVDGSTLRHAPDGVPLAASLNVLGIAGQTAWVGMNDIGRPQPGDTVVVTAAAGGVGYVAVQLAVAAGARVVGIAGTAEKCAWVRELGAVECINYKSEEVAEAAAGLCPDGIDVIFDNVGGAMLDAMLPQLAVNARIVLCGAISRYASDQGPAPLRNWFHLLTSRARAEGFIYMDHEHRFAEIEADLLLMIRRGQIRSREHVVNGLQAAPEALRMLFDGANTGKLLIRVGTPPSRPED
jgi:NADPH-dependent curcumin reductase CurA